MPSPFPGMDPYLEQPNLWPSFHFRLIGAIAAAIGPQLSQNYYVEVETRTYQSQAAEELLIGIADAAVVSRAVEKVSSQNASEQPAAVATQTRPQRVTLPMPVPIKERYLEVREVGSDAVITVIEVLSPTNKRPGEGRNIYAAKRRNILGSASHLVEIDLLRGGQPMPMLGPTDPVAYRLLVSRSEQRPAADLYGVALPQPLPTIPIPLKSDDADVTIDLQAIVNRVYDEARYIIRLDYSQMPPLPALTSEEQNWIKAVVASRE